MMWTEAYDIFTTLFNDFALWDPTIIVDINSPFWDSENTSLYLARYILSAPESGCPWGSGRLRE